MKREKDAIALDDNLFLGEGTSRKCYMHPSDKSLCIKIPTQKGVRSAKREVNYLKRLHRRGVSLQMISDYKGEINTNLGRGYLFELIRDSDAQISKSLEYYLSINDEVIKAQIVKNIEDLREYLLKEYILFSDLDVDNILVKREKNGTLKFVIIDGVGDNNQIPFLEFLKPLGLKRSARKWDGFKANIIQESPDLSEHIKDFNDEFRYADCTKSNSNNED